MIPFLDMVPVVLKLAGHQGSTSPPHPAEVALQTLAGLAHDHTGQQNDTIASLEMQIVTLKAQLDAKDATINTLRRSIQMMVQARQMAPSG